jgi:hypothetical protein
MKLLDFPNELLGSDFDFLTNKDIKQLRLVSKAVKAKTNLRFTRIFVSPDRTNIDVFRNIVNHDEFKKDVEEIVWDDARLIVHNGGIDFDDFLEGPGMDDEDEWRANEGFAQMKKQLWGKDANEVSFEGNFRIYCQLQKDQQAIIKS